MKGASDVYSILQFTIRVAAEYPATSTQMHKSSARHQRLVFSSVFTITTRRLKLFRSCNLWQAKA